MGKIFKDKARTSEEVLAGQGDSFGVKTENENWHGTDLRAKSTPIMDPGVGKPLIIRSFEFSRNPEFKGTITKQDLFNMHWRQLRVMLWGDGLVPREDINPRIEFMRNNKYRIFITCEPRLGTFVQESPQTLNKLLQKKKR